MLTRTIFYCIVVFVFERDKKIYARVAQWWSIALPRRGSRVRIPSRALFKLGGNFEFIRFFAFFYGGGMKTYFYVNYPVCLFFRSFTALLLWDYRFLLPSVG